MDAKIFFIIIGMMVVTYLPRVLPLVFLTKIDIHPLFLRWLKFIPVAVLASLLAPEILLSGGKLDLTLTNTYLLATLPCVAIAFVTRNLFYTVFTGMGAMVLLARLF